MEEIKYINKIDEFLECRLGERVAYKDRVFIVIELHYPTDDELLPSVLLLSSNDTQLRLHINKKGECKK